MMLLPILLLACDNPSPSATTPSATTPSASTPPASTPPASTPPATTPPASTPSAPYTVEQVDRIDGFTFWGWSKDSRYFAFETYYPGSGGASCDMRAELHIVDASTDRYAVPPLIQGYPSIEGGEDGRCHGPAPQEALATLRPGALSQYGISTAHLVAPIVNTEGSADWLVEPQSGPWFRLTIEQTGKSDPASYVGDAGFRLLMHEVGHAGQPKVIESGERTREGAVGYGLSMVFPAPDDEHVAIIVTKERLDYEGTSTGFMSNGTTRIPPMEVEDGE